jgi:hypothetical protein
MCSRCAHDPSARAKHRNATTFKNGPDRRRHVFSTAERQAGFRSTMDAIYSWAAIERPEAYAAAWRRIRAHLKNRHLAPV